MLQQSHAQSHLSQNSDIKQLTGLIKSSPNPQQMIMQLAQKNPHMSQIMNELNTSGMSAKDLFYNKAKQLGVDPNQILGMLK